LSRPVGAEAEHEHDERAGAYTRQQTLATADGVHARPQMTNNVPAGRIPGGRLLAQGRRHSRGVQGTEVTILQHPVTV
jgi:hypothetical protein